MNSTRKINDYGVPDGADVKDVNDAKDDALFWFAKLRRFDDVRLGFHLHELPSVEALSCPFLMSMYRSGRSSLLPVKDIENDLKELLTSPTDDRRVSVEDRLRLLFDVMLNVLCEVSIEIVRGLILIVKRV